MKIIKRVLISTFIILFIVIFTSHNTVDAKGNKVSNIMKNVGVSTDAVNQSDLEDLQKMLGKILGFLQVASGLVSVLVIAFLGFTYIVEDANIKNEVKSKMLPILIGLVLVFSAVSISKFILGAVESSDSMTTYDRTQVVEH